MSTLRIDPQFRLLEVRNLTIDDFDDGHLIDKTFHNSKVQKQINQRSRNVRRAKSWQSGFKDGMRLGLFAENHSFRTDRELSASYSAGVTDACMMRQVCWKQWKAVYSTEVLSDE